MGRSNPANDAAAMVGAQIDPQIAELRRQLALAQQQNAQGVQDTKAGYGYLAAGAAKNAANIDSIYNGAKSTSGQAYANLQASLQKLYGNATNTTADEMHRLGIDQGGIGNITAKNDSDRALLMGLAQNRAASSGSTLEALRTGFHSGALQGGEIAKATGQRKVDELGQALRNMQMEYNGKIGDLEGTRAGLIAKTQRELADDALNRQLKELQLQQAKAAAANGGISAKDTLDAAIAEQKLKGMLQGSGSQAAYNYLQEVAKGDSKKSVDLQNILKTLETNNYMLPHQDGTYDKKSKKAGKFSWNNPDTLTHLNVAVGRHADEGWGQSEIDALRKAMDIYFGKN